MMTGTDLIALSPLLIVAAASVVLLLLAAFYRDDRVTAVLTLVGLALAILALPVAAAQAPRHVTPLLVLDDYALFYMGLVFAASFAVTLLSYGYLRKHNRQREEFYILLLTAALGSAVLVASDHFASFFLGLEILSISLYALIAYPRASQQHIEAAVKYLVLAAASAAFLLFGMALIYAATGTLEFARMSAAGSAAGNSDHALWLAGWGMIIVGVGFKLAVVPFHLWTPDVYEGAPAPVAAFVATVSKGSMFALLMRYYTQADLQAYGAPILALAIIAIASMFAGNLLALFQSNIKRLLAYSSIAHLGYLLVALLAGGALAATAVGFYLLAYFVTMLGAFGVVSALSHRERDADAMSDYQGLFWRRPWLAALLTAVLLSLAGIPLTAGFVGKFYIVAAGVSSALWLLVLVLVVNSAIGLFYYLRVVVALFGSAPDGEHVQAPKAAVSWIDGVVLAALAFLLFWLGVYPSPIINVIEKTAGGQSYTRTVRLD
jgi:NADH-quinone oxidoreductase subunit N